MYTFDKQRTHSRIGTASFGCGCSPMWTGDRAVEGVGCLPRER